MDGSRTARGIFEGDINGRRPVGKEKASRTDGVTKHSRKLTGRYRRMDRPDNLGK